MNHRDLPPIEQRHHAFHVHRDGSWTDVSTGQPYTGPFKGMVDLSKVAASEWQTEQIPLPLTWQWIDRWVMRPLCWVGGFVASAVILSACIAWVFRAYAPDWLKALASS